MTAGRPRIYVKIPRDHKHQFVQQMYIIRSWGKTLSQAFKSDHHSMNEHSVDNREVLPISVHLLPLQRFSMPLSEQNVSCKVSHINFSISKGTMWRKFFFPSGPKLGLSVQRLKSHLYWLLSLPTKNLLHIIIRLTNEYRNGHKLSSFPGWPRKAWRQEEYITCYFCLVISHSTSLAGPGAVYLHKFTYRRAFPILHWLEISRAPSFPWTIIFVSRAHSLSIRCVFISSIERHC